MIKTDNYLFIFSVGKDRISSVPKRFDINYFYNFSKYLFQRIMNNYIYIGNSKVTKLSQ